MLGARHRGALGAVVGLMLGAQAAGAQDASVPAPDPEAPAPEPSVEPQPLDPAASPIAVQPPHGVPAPRTVTVVVPEGHPTLPLLRAELTALGLGVHEVSPGAPAPASELRVVLREGSIEVWIFDPETGRLTMREVFSQADGTPVESLTAVLHAVELLRSHLAAPAPPRVVAPPAPPPAPASPRRRARATARLSAAPVLVYSPGGTRVGVGALVDAAVWGARFGVRGLWVSALVPNQHSAPEGVATATSRFVGVEGLWRMTPRASPFVAQLGAGGVMVSTKLRATAEPGYRAAEDHVLTLAPVLDARVGLALSERAALLSQGALLTPLRSDRLYFAEREVARHGALFATCGVGVEVTLR